MKVKEYIAQIVAKGSAEDMQKLAEMLDEAIIKLKLHDEECYIECKTELYEILNGKKITKEMADEWVDSMKPRAKWTKEETERVLAPYGIDSIEGYVVMNMLYSDMKDVLGTGDDQESLNRYMQATQDWLNDEDAKKEKLYLYKKYIVK